ncbi:creatininase family protein [Candidatus Fermentibacteria bacterium]|nr:creatininase family protein [Candidatus Fermentibacteria bacterium]
MRVPFDRLLTTALATLTVAALGSIPGVRAESPRHLPAPPERCIEGGYSVFAGTMADMKWPEIEEAAQAGAVVLIPVGVIEEHGPHIACGADIYQACVYCQLAAQGLRARGLPAVVAPPFYWGVNTSTRRFPGSFDTTPETMKAVLTEILANLKSWGFREAYLVNLHGEWGHNEVLIDVAREGRQSPGMCARMVMSDRLARRHGLNGNEDYVTLVQFEPPPGGPVVSGPEFHAGAEETGDMAAFLPGLVDTAQARTLSPPHVEEDRYRAWGQDARVVTPLGYAGDPSVHDAEWSRRAVLSFVEGMAVAITHQSRAR